MTREQEQAIQENGLLAELGYLKLENKSNNQSLADFINGYDRQNNTYLTEKERYAQTGIESDRKTTIYHCLINTTSFALQNLQQQTFKGC